MESNDVIELGSSDDEAELSIIKDIKPSQNETKHSDDEAGPPPSKKMKYVQNAMVHFPNKLPDIMPSKNKQRGIGKILTSTKIHNSTNVNMVTVVHKNKSNGRHIQKCTNKTNLRVKSFEEGPNKLKINPMNVLNVSPVVINRTSTTPKVERRQLSVQTPRVLSNLPPSITVKKTTKTFPGVVLNRNKIRSLEITNGGTVTVPHHNKSSQSLKAAASPQWYMNPEEINEESLEIQNNKEPASTTMIEITIDDSPVKPCVSKPCGKSKIQDEQLSIIIEDSPIKPLNHANSDCEDNCKQDKNEIPISKKKLVYQENIESSSIEINTVETVYDVPIENKSAGEKVKEDLESMEIQDSSVNESSTLVKQTCATAKSAADALVKDMPKKTDQEHQETKKLTQDEDNNTKTNENVGEFHPIYQKFIDLCFELENSDDMRKIVEKKIKTYYKQVSKEYVESDEFLDLVSKKLCLMRQSPEKMYLYIKDIVDDLNIQRKMTKSHTLVNSDTPTYFIEREKLTEVFEDPKYERKRRKQIRKLEKTIKKLHKAIKKLEEQEVDFDDEENSVYLLTERYKERLVRVHAKLCQVTNTKMPSEPRIHIQCRPGKPPGPAKRLEKWVNKKVPLGTPLPFPDFHDVLKCVKQANEEDKLGWNEAEIMDEARDLFTRCGRKLQKRRQENEWRLATSRITEDADPAQENEALKKKLDENKTIAAEKETELFNKYADQQAQLKLEGVEIGDKEADESPVESEDEEMSDGSNLLDDKGKRKDCLRRLLKEKSRKYLEGNKQFESVPEKKDLSEDVPKVTNEEDDITKIESINTSEDKVTTSSNQCSEISLEGNKEFESLPEKKDPPEDFPKVTNEENDITKIESINISEHKVTASSNQCSEISLEGSKEFESLPEKEDLFEDVPKVTNEEIDITKIESINTSEDKITTSSNQCSEIFLEGNKEFESLPEKEDLSEDVPKVTDEEKDITKIESINTSEDKVTTSSNQCSEISLEGNKEFESLPEKEDLSEDVPKVTNEENDTTKIESINASEGKDSTSSNQCSEISIKNETVDDKVENRMDEDDVVAEVMSDAYSDNDVEEVNDQNTVVKTDTKFNDDDDSINLISDDSDVEELNLLQELHSGDEVSSPESSDIDDSPIATKKLQANDQNYDVISIENSSYSESESTKDDVLSDEIEDKIVIKNPKNVEQDVYNLDDDSQDCQEAVIGEESNDHENYGDASLLASSEDEDITNKDVALDKYSGNYINLKDDEISISETQVQEVRNYTLNETGDCNLTQTVPDENSDSDMEIQVEGTNETAIDGTASTEMECDDSMSIDDTVDDKVTEKDTDNQIIQASTTVTMCDVILEDDDSLKASETSQRPSINSSVLCEDSPYSPKSPKPEASKEIQIKTMPGS